MSALSWSVMVVKWMPSVNVPYVWMVLLAGCGDAGLVDGHAVGDDDRPVGVFVEKFPAVDAPAACGMARSGSAGLLSAVFKAGSPGMLFALFCVVPS